MKPEDYNRIRYDALLLSSQHNVEPCYTLWNTFAEDFPFEANSLQGTEFDCYGNSKNVPRFLKKLKELCNVAEG